jgi:leader peptidase (prepilin peptidase)/N-methyltransferase
MGAVAAFYAWNALAGPWDAMPSAIDLCTTVLFAAGKVLFFWLLTALAVLDAEHFWLPDWLTLPGIGLGIGLKFLNLALIVREHNPDIFELERYGVYGAALKWLMGALAAAALVLAIRWIYWLVRRREGIGLGDAKLMALLAAWLGFPAALLSFGLAALLGTLAGFALIALPRLRRAPGAWAATKLPLGTFLCAGGMVSALWGPHLIAVYLRWAGLSGT